MRRFQFMVMVLALVVAAGGCKKKPPVATPTPPGSSTRPATFPGAISPGSGSGANRTVTPPGPPDPAVAPISTPANPTVTEDPLVKMTPEEINLQSPLTPVFFAYDSEEVDDAARKALAENAKVLKAYPSWVITIEGHSDERGTAEYNLALGDRRALAVKSYLISLGVPADRLRTVSYGKEFPFDPGHVESAWTLNRRAHFVVTSK